MALVPSSGKLVDPLARDTLTLHHSSVKLLRYAPQTRSYTSLVTGKWLFKTQYFHHTTYLKKQGHMNHLVKDSINICLYHDNFNTDTKFTVSHSTYLPTDTLKWGMASRNKRTKDEWQMSIQVKPHGLWRQTAWMHQLFSQWFKPGQDMKLPELTLCHVIIYHTDSDNTEEGDIQNAAYKIQFHMADSPRTHYCLIYI